MVSRFSFGRLPALAGGIVGLFVLAGGAGCGPTKPYTHPVVKRAMFDLDCPRKQIHYTEIDDETIGVRGCGKQTKYVQICNQGAYSQDCKWIEN